MHFFLKVGRFSWNLDLNSPIKVLEAVYKSSFKNLTGFYFYIEQTTPLLSGVKARSFKWCRVRKGSPAEW